MDERALRVAEAIRSAGADWAILTAPASVSYATGHGEPAGAGRSPFAGGPAVAIVSAGGEAVLVAADADLDPGAVRADATRTYPAFALPPGGPGLDGLYLAAVAAALAETGAGGTVAIEPAACPSLTRGELAYDFGDTGHLTPLVKMHTLGSTFVPPGFHAGGLRYHGMAPLVSHLHQLGLIEARAYHQTAVFEAGVRFARAEGILPAPEANHAVKAAIDEALRCKEEGVTETILFNLSGHGHFDMGAYIDHFAGKLEDLEYDEEELATALAGLPAVVV